MGAIKSNTTAQPFFALMFSERELYDLAIKIMDKENKEMLRK